MYEVEFELGLLGGIQKGSEGMGGGWYHWHKDMEAGICLASLKAPPGLIL